MCKVDFKKYIAYPENYYSVSYEVDDKAVRTHDSNPTARELTWLPCDGPGSASHLSSGVLQNFENDYCLRLKARLKIVEIEQMTKLWRRRARIHYNGRKLLAPVFVELQKSPKKWPLEFF